MTVKSNMAHWKTAALLLGLLLLAAAPRALCQEDDEDVEEGDIGEEMVEYDEDDEYEDVELPEGEGGGDGKDEEPSEKDVVVITAKNFDDVVGKAKFALVEFYAPWCGHCKKLKPEYAKAATVLKEYNEDIVIGKVDATKEKDLAEKYEVQGYPTLKWFTDGDATEYSGGRDTDSIVRWVKKKTGPPALVITSLEDLKKAEGENEVIVLGYFEKFEGGVFDQFVAAARKAEDVTHAQTTNKDVAIKAGAADKPPSVAIIKNFDDEDRETMVLKKDISAENLEEFAQAEKLPLVIPFIDKNQDKIFDSGIDRQLLVVGKTTDLEADGKLMKDVKAVAPNFKGKIIFVTVDVDSDSAQSVLNFFGLEKEILPQVVSFELTESKKYKMPGKITEESLKKFVSGVLDGTVEPDYKSEEIPKNDKDGDVQIVVGKTFNGIVKDPKKDVLLEVYAPWCGHCKALEPTYKKLAKRFAKIDSVVIAKMDGTANEHKEVDIQGFPTILFFPAGEDSEEVSFEGGDRSLKELTKFIKQHATIEYELPKKKSASDNETDEPTGGDKSEL